VTEDGGDVDDDSENDQADSGPEGEAGAVGWEVGFGGVELAEEETEAGDGESDAHEAEAGADPGEEGALCGEVDARVLFGGLFHVGIVMGGNRERATEYGIGI
jgi:hypothetical protein